jgi:hypothetical protein
MFDLIDIGFINISLQHIIAMEVEEFVLDYTQHVISVCHWKQLSLVLLFGVLAVYLGCMMCFLPSLHLHCHVCGA